MIGYLLSNDECYEVDDQRSSRNSMVKQDEEDRFYLYVIPNLDDSINEPLKMPVPRRGSFARLRCKFL